MTVDDWLEGLTSYYTPFVDGGARKRNRAAGGESR